MPAGIGELARRDDHRAVAAVEREALDAVVAGVGDVDDVAARRPGRRPRAASLPPPAPKRNWPDAVARPAPGVRAALPLGVEAVDAVRAVGDEQRAVAGDRDRRRRAPSWPRLGARRCRSRAGTRRRGRRPARRASPGRRRRPSRRGRSATACGKRRTPSARWPIWPTRRSTGTSPLRARAVGARRARERGHAGQDEGRRERAQRAGEGPDRARCHHPILNTRARTSRAAGASARDGSCTGRSVDREHDERRVVLERVGRAARHRVLDRQWRSPRPWVRSRAWIARCMPSTPNRPPVFDRALRDPVGVEDQAVPGFEAHRAHLEARRCVAGAERRDGLGPRAG